MLRNSHRFTEPGFPEIPDDPAYGEAHMADERDRHIAPSPPRASLVTILLLLACSSTATAQQDLAPPEPILEGNLATIQQTGKRHVALIEQSGDANEASIEQLDRDNWAKITQIGIDNEAHVLQDGKDLRAEILQEGDHNFVDIVQPPDVIDLTVRQVGDYMNFRMTSP